jgi:hypothetical protein
VVGVMTERVIIAVRDKVGCPRCDAAAGEPCRYVGLLLMEGKAWLDGIHTARYRAARSA